MKARLSDYGARIRSLNAGGYDINLASPGANMRRKSIEHIKSVIDLAVAWDVPEVVISPGTRRPMISPPIDKAYGWMYESLGDLIPLAKEAGTATPPRKHSLLLHSDHPGAGRYRRVRSTMMC